MKLSKSSFKNAERKISTDAQEGNPPNFVRKMVRKFSTSENLMKLTFTIESKHKSK